MLVKKGFFPSCFHFLLWECPSHFPSLFLQVDHLEIPGKSRIRVPGLNDPVELGLLDYFYYPISGSGIITVLDMLLQFHYNYSSKFYNIYLSK